MNDPVTGATPFPPVEPAAGRRRGMLFAAGLFLAGVLVGGAGALLAVRGAIFHPPAGGWANRRILAAMTRELDLDAAQREKIGAILRETRGELFGVADRVEPEVRAALGRARDRIRAELRPEQQPKFDRAAARRAEELDALRRRLRQPG